MNYSIEIEIKKPIETVIGLFDNSDIMGKWMEGLQSFEHLISTQGQVGAKSKLVFQMGKRKLGMIETILIRHLPDEFSGTYEADGVHNMVKNSFVKIAENKTKFITYNEFQFKGFMKFIAFIMPGALKKQSMKYLEAFKIFEESQ